MSRSHDHYPGNQLFITVCLPWRCDILVCQIFSLFKISAPCARIQQLPSCIHTTKHYFHHLVASEIPWTKRGSYRLEVCVQRAFTVQLCTSPNTDWMQWSTLSCSNSSGVLWIKVKKSITVPLGDPSVSLSASLRLKAFRLSVPKLRPGFGTANQYGMLIQPTLLNEWCPVDGHYNEVSWKLDTT